MPTAWMTMNPTRARGNLSSRLPDRTGSEVEVRPLRTHEERDACVELQRATWGSTYEDVVPASILKVSQQVGGVAAGAFLQTSELVGFVYGMTGVREKHLIHWSHMLGVLRGHRGQGIGQQLKLFQRAWLVDRGVGEMRWTFDPLVSGNAHFNLNLLGVRIHQYVPEMYGETGSGLHSFGTDRFVAHWDLTVPLDEGRYPAANSIDWEASPLLNGRTSEQDGTGHERGDPAPGVRIVIPYDIVSLNREDPEVARGWRRSTRAAFETARQAGYEVVGFSRSREADRGHYLLAHSSALASP